jgi:hypothetical protein
MATLACSEAAASPAESCLSFPLITAWATSRQRVVAFTASGVPGRPERRRCVARPPRVERRVGLDVRLRGKRTHLNGGLGLVSVRPRGPRHVLYLTRRARLVDC